MLSLPGKSIRAIKKLLLKRQKEVEEQIREVSDDDPVTAPALAESSEPGTDSWMADAHSRTIALKDQLVKAANSVKTALFKIKKRTYGTCESCKKDIEPARLEAMPTASLCLSCSKKAVNVFFPRQSS